MKMHAVITGDINNFTQLAGDARSKLISETEALLRSMVRNQQDAAVFRGDSYQLIIDDIGQVLEQCIRLVCWFKINSDKQKGIDLGTRLSIGIGEIAYLGKNVLDSDGEAFHLSGRNFDAMEKEEVIRLVTADAEKTAMYQVIMMYINMICREWSVNQAFTIYHLLSKQGSTQEAVARVLNMSQPAIAKSLRAARWKEVEKGISFINKQLISYTKHGA